VKTVLHTTAHHRIWDQTKHAFVDAADRAAGHQVRTGDGHAWTLAGKRSWAGSQRMYDITVGLTTPSSSWPARRLSGSTTAEPEMRKAITGTR
jgi:hypothetical protein